jgi:eukaryotic-like serine/threonine-protein kinase
MGLYAEYSPSEIDTPLPAHTPEPMFAVRASVAPLKPTPTIGWPAPKPESMPTAEDTHHGAPISVPGYRTDTVLGYGGMGTVYLAKQLSLDRPVALKVMSKRWSNDPIFVARFTREAYAAAQMNHPNVVQIYDIGEVDGHRYFSMEYVPGRSLADHIKIEGKLDPESAVGFVLQAARGLNHAHERGMIHRDVKPDNLLLNDQGIVKVADLGLVKTPWMSRQADDLDKGLHTIPPEMTGARMALGTPAYMAPEQCRDATNVDHRADIYSLGCTLYVLVTGRPPFDGKTAVELMTKHAYEELIPPEMVVSRVPKELSGVILKMMAKNREERFASMNDVIRTLEQWLGIHHAGRFSPRDEQIDQLEKHVREFNEAPTAMLKNRLLTGSLSVVILVAVLLMFFAKLGWAFGLAGMVLQASLAYFVVSGVAHKTYLFRRVRHFVIESTAWDFMLAVAGVALFGLMLWMTGIFWLVIGFGFIGVAIALAIRLALDRTIEAEQHLPLRATEKLLRRLRINGLDEEAIQQFVAKYSGRDWEEFFEALFGFEAKLSTRALLLRGNSAGLREKYAAWREPLVNLIDRIEQARKEARERKLLKVVEEARLLATGIGLQDAQNQASDAVNALLLHADAVRRADVRREAGRPIGRSLSHAPSLSDTQWPVTRVREAAPKVDLASRVVNVFVGTHVRIVAAMVFFAAFLLWVQQNIAILGDASFSTRPLELAFIPAEYTAWCDTLNAGWAGVLLLASVFFRGNRMAILAILGAAICAFGARFGIRTVEPIRDYHVAMTLGSVFALIGYRLGER